MGFLLPCQLLINSRILGKSSRVRLCSKLTFCEHSGFLQGKPSVFQRKTFPWGLFATTFLAFFFFFLLVFVAKPQPVCGSPQTLSDMLAVYI